MKKSLLVALLLSFAGAGCEKKEPKPVVSTGSQVKPASAVQR
jgi:hypothetical protein